DHMSLLDLEMIHEPNDILGHLEAIFLWIVWLVTLAMATVVQCDHLVLRRKRSDNARCPPVLVDVGRESVNQDDRLAGTFHYVVDLHAIRIEGPFFRPRPCGKHENHTANQRYRSS